MPSRLLRFARRDLKPLSANGAHALAAKHALLHFPSGAIYSFIPKNACTTMRYSLAVENGCIAGPEDINWVHNNNATFSAGLRDLIMAPYTFVILRCPFRRLASVYQDKVVSRTPDFWNFYELSGRAFDPDTLTFREFIRLMRHPQYLNCNIHWRPQTHFLVYEEYDDWFALENFEMVKDTVLRKCEWTLRDASELSNHSVRRHTPMEGSFYGDAPASEYRELHLAGKAPSYRAMYDDEIVSLVSQTYRQDISLYTDRCDARNLMFDSGPSSAGIINA